MIAAFDYARLCRQTETKPPLLFVAHREEILRQRGHAEYMARFFNDHGLPSVALTAESPDDVRRSRAAAPSVTRCQFHFVVDLYNEGVDIPEVDTLLLLRRPRVSPFICSS